MAEKLAHMQHEEWLATRPKATKALIAKALDVLARPAANAPVWRLDGRQFGSYGRQPRILHA